MAKQLEDDRDAIGAVGNGYALAYFSGPDIRTMYAPHYSTAPVLTTRWSPELDWTEYISVESSWIFDTPGLRLHVFSDVGLPAITYRFEGHGCGPTIDLSPPAAPAPAPTSGASGGWNLISAPGSPAPVAAADVPVGRPVFVYPSSRSRLAAVTGSGVALEAAPGSHTLRVELTAPSGWFSVIGADDLTHLDDVVQALHAGGVTPRESAAQNERSARLAQLSVGPAAESTTVAFAQAADQLLAQQSSAGGYIAGDRYPLSYLRDQYGTSAGLLSLGLTESVERGLRFRLGTWRRFGDLANAESMGGDGIRHFHENDDVEQTGYLVLSVLDLAETSPSTRLEDFADLIGWCLRRQHDHLLDGALPFNGDETYIAGGMLPRWAIEDGSLEATVLYAECLRRIGPHLGLLRVHGIDSSWLADELRVIEASFARNFVRDGVLITNSLLRRGRTTRSHRTGVCERCGRFPLGLRRTASGRFLCITCVAVPLEPAPSSEKFISSAALMAISSGTPLIDASVLKATTHAAGTAIDDALVNGTITGYDEGLLARALARTGDSVEAIRSTILGRRDRYGTWSEYYRTGDPIGARCRPWETGMNVLALALTEPHLPSHQKGSRP